jgi:hypothetical protein
MNFRVIPLNYTKCPDYPYDYRIELLSYLREELDGLWQWLGDNRVPHTRVGSVVYLREADALVFLLKWAL